MRRGTIVLLVIIVIVALVLLSTFKPVSNAPDKVTVTAASISISGLIGWAGLIIPHLARRLVGADASRTVPAALLMGATFLILCDDLGRTLLAGEIPLGILTSLLGALVFILLMTRPILPQS